MRPPHSSVGMPEIQFERVCFAYPGGPDIYPNEGLTLSLETGVTALVGENGAGKTTLTKLLNGLLRPSSGRVTVAGLDVSSLSVARMARTVGYAFQNPDDQLFERTVKAEVSFGPRVQGRSAVETERGVSRAIELCGLAGKEEVHPHDLGLSERKWVAIASALATEPAVIVLDEPTLGQDTASRERLRILVEQLAREGRLILVVTHDMDFVGEACPQTVVLTHGDVRHVGLTSEAFANTSMIADAGLEPPHVMLIARALHLRPAVNEAGFLAQL
jgi:energy-coupling factor transport system ATP-binding protein